MLYTWDRGVNAGLGSLVLGGNVYFLSVHPVKWGLNCTCFPGGETETDRASCSHLVAEPGHVWSLGSGDQAFHPVL